MVSLVLPYVLFMVLIHINISNTHAPLMSCVRISIQSFSMQWNLINYENCEYTHCDTNQFVFRECHRLTRSSVSVLVGSSLIRIRKQNGSEEMCTAFSLDELYDRFGNWHK